MVEQKFLFLLPIREQSRQLSRFTRVHWYVEMICHPVALASVGINDQNAIAMYMDPGGGNPFVNRYARIPAAGR